MLGYHPQTNIEGDNWRQTTRIQATSQGHAPYRNKNVQERCPCLCLLGIREDKVPVAPPASALEPQGRIDDGQHRTQEGEQQGTGNLEESVTTLSSAEDRDSPSESSNWREDIESTPILASVLQQWRNSYDIPRQGTYDVEDLPNSMDSWEDDTLDDISSLTDEEWDSSSGSVRSEEEEEVLIPREFLPLRSAKAKELLKKIYLASRPSSGNISQVAPALRYVAQKLLEVTTHQLLELPWSACSKLMWTVISSPYCSVDLVLDLLLAKVKEGPWLPTGEEQQTELPITAATANATRIIGQIVKFTEDPRVLEAWFPELLLGLVNNIFEVASLQSRNQTRHCLPPK
ncbi:uncharacterized protein LOC133368051 [Rhineura floridana]|uniref:uncharacterized protein LOC133368051 n=1 Tax=Rhineura floridana TaxID=261503 RepID=UPI002AC8534A|nr:uncharacterized protein LOC133368051 [Rhineura floridana]